MRLFSIVVVILLAIAMVLYFRYNYRSLDFNFDAVQHSVSLRAAKQREVFLKEYKFNPSYVVDRGDTVNILQAWAEVSWKYSSPDFTKISIAGDTNLHIRLTRELSDLSLLGVSANGSKRVGIANKDTYYFPVSNLEGLNCLRFKSTGSKDSLVVRVYPE